MALILQMTSKHPNHNILMWVENTATVQKQTSQNNTTVKKVMVQDEIKLLEKCVF